MSEGPSLQTLLTNYLTKHSVFKFCGAGVGLQQGSLVEAQFVPYQVLNSKEDRDSSRVRITHLQAVDSRAGARGHP
jgi:hypothetical protein